MRIVKAERTDLREILQLQHLAFQSEAKLLGNDQIPPLLQTLPELEDELRRGVVLKAVDDEGNLIGSVRGYVEENTLHIGKLIVQPALQGRGIGRKLMDAIEQLYPHARYEIFTSSKSARNIRMYENRGYRAFKTKATAGVTIVYMEKHGCFREANTTVA